MEGVLELLMSTQVTLRDCNPSPQVPLLAMHWGGEDMVDKDALFHKHDLYKPLRR